MPIVAFSSADAAPLITGTGSPNGVAGLDTNSIYIDENAGGVYIYTGINPGGWTALGGVHDSTNATDHGYPVGTSELGSGRVFTLSASAKKAIFSDVSAQNNSGDGLYWNNAEAADQSQRLDVVVGAGVLAFSVHADGTVHIRTGTTVTADL